MGYERIGWTDRIVERPRTYTIRENGDGSVTLMPVPGEVKQAGTPLSAANLNRMDDGIAGLRQDADNMAKDAKALREDMQKLAAEMESMLQTVQRAVFWMESIRQAEDRAQQSRLDALEARVTALDGGGANG
ncbi:MAG: hypothetical protein ACI4PG_02180 [Candidatus Ventricola sp.]